VKGAFSGCGCVQREVFDEDLADGGSWGWGKGEGEVFDIDFEGVWNVFGKWKFCGGVKVGL
jgi:hypothetical protein